MSQTKTHRPARFSLLPAVLLAVLATMTLAATSASAAVEWRITSAHGPQNMPPGGIGGYAIQAFNVGDQSTIDDGGTPEDESDDTPLTYTITDQLPAGLTAIAATGPGWSCAGLGTETVSCESSEVVFPAGENAAVRGAVKPLEITVAVPPSAIGTADYTVTISGGGAADATVLDATAFRSTPAGFGFRSFAADLFDAQFPAGAPTRQAGSHPFELRVDFGMSLALRHNPDAPGIGDHYYTTPDEHAKTLETKLPVGLIGNPEATPRCPLAVFTDAGPASKGACPANTQVGTIDLLLNHGELLDLPIDGATDVPVYNLETPANTVAVFGFSILSNPVYIEAALDPADRHSVVTTVSDTTELFTVRSASLTMWGVPADPAHDALRMQGDAIDGSTAMNTPSTAPIAPFLTLPGQCDTPAGAIQMRADSWQHPGAFTPWQQGAEIEAEGCEDPRIRFNPTISIQPTSHQAASPTGLDIDLHVPQKQDVFPNSDAAANAANAARLYASSGDDRAIVTPNLKDAVTKLPLGMAVNPSIADGLTGCSQAQVGLKSNEDPTCPDSSKIGTVEIDSPLVPDTLKGSVYQAKQSDSPHGSLLGFYTVAKGEGLTIKLAARVDADPESGQLTTTFLDSPQLAFSHYRLHFNSGPRAPLVNPPLCGAHASTARFTAWNSSVEPVETGDVMQITSGPGGGPCSSSLAGRPFAPGFDAKTLLPIAGAFSPFALEVAREDGSQELRTIETTLPPGMLGRLAGVPYCPEAVVASISAAPGSGLPQRLSPSCPAASLVGHTDAAAGAGSLPFHNPGSAYLTGPYKGAPLSLAIVTPIVAGPLDLGSVVVRAALFVDPATAQVRVLSDPIPEKVVAAGTGYPLNLRSVRVEMDRPSFTLNPTSCAAMAVTGTIGSLQGAAAAVSERFQVGACKALDFKPQLSFKLSGSTKRGGHPALRAVLKAKPGEANIAKARVSLPHSEFLAQDHIRTICTRVQFAAEACPAASVYGQARAFSPLLDRPLEGPVYLRSSSNPLPDLVADLNGQIEIDLVGRIDSKNSGIRTTFATVPDAPVSKFVLEMRGGRKSLLENSRDLCAGVNRATVQLDGHSGKAHDFQAKLKSSCGAKGKKRAR